MLLTVWTKRGRKSISISSEALDEVRKIVYNNDRVIEYSIAVCEYERIENVELLEKCN